MFSRKFKDKGSLNHGDPLIFSEAPPTSFTVAPATSPDLSKKPVKTGQVVESENKETSERVGVEIQLDSDYSGQYDVQGILALRIHELNLSSTFMPNYIVGNSAISLKQYLSDERDEHDGARNLLVSYNVAGNHWVGIFFSLNNKKIITEVIFIDSLEENPNFKEIEKIIREGSEIYPELAYIEIKNQKGWQQPESASSGPLTVENLLLLAQKKALPNMTISEDMLIAIRQQHEQIYAATDPTFYERQQDNKNRFVSFQEYKCFKEADLNNYNWYELECMTRILSLISLITDESIRDKIIGAITANQNEEIADHLNRMRSIFEIVKEKSTRKDYNIICELIETFLVLETDAEQRLTSFNQIRFRLPYQSYEWIISNLNIKGIDIEIGSALTALGVQIAKDERVLRNLQFRLWQEETSKKNTDTDGKKTMPLNKRKGFFDGDKVRSDGYFWLSLLFMTMRLAIGGSSVYWISELSAGYSVYQNLILFVASCTLTTLPDILCSRFSEKLKSRFVKDYITKFCDSYQNNPKFVLDKEFKKTQAPMLTKDCQREIDEGGSALYQLISTTTFYIVEMAIMAVIINPYYLIGYGGGVICYFAAIAPFTSSLRQKTKALKEAERKLDFVLEAAWDTKVSGNDYNNTIWDKHFSETYANCERIRISRKTLLGAVSATGAIFSAVPFVAIASYLLSQVERESPEEDLLVSILPRQLQALQYLNVFSRSWIAYRDAKHKVEFLKQAFEEAGRHVYEVDKNITWKRIDVFYNGKPIQYEDKDSFVLDLQAKDTGRFTIQGDNKAGKSHLLCALKSVLDVPALYVHSDASLLFNSSFMHSSSGGQAMNKLSEIEEYTQNKYLLLDELDSHLSTKNLQKFSDRLEDISKKRVVIEITHRSIILKKGNSEEKSPKPLIYSPLGSLTINGEGSSSSSSPLLPSR